MREDLKHAPRIEYEVPPNFWASEYLISREGEWDHS